MPDTKTEKIKVSRLVDPISRTFEPVKGFTYRRGMTVQDLAPKNTLDLDQLGVEVWATVNGYRHDSKDWHKSFVEPGDEIVFIHRVEGVETILWIVMTVILTAVNIYMARGQKVDTGDSPTYNWGDVQTTTRHGQPILTVFGEHKVGGQYINVFQTVNDQGDPALNALVCLGEGEYKAIAAKERGGAPDDSIDLATYGPNIEINGVDADAVPGVSISVRHGYKRQKVVGGFEDLVIQQTVGAECPGGTWLKTNTIEPAEAIELIFNWPEGLYYQGQILHAYRVDYLVLLKRLDGFQGNPTINSWVSGEILLAGAEGYIAKFYKIKKKQTSPFTSSVKIDGLLSGLYEVVVYRRTVGGPIFEAQGFHSKFILQTINLIKYDQGLAYPKRALVGFQAVPSENLNGALPNFATIVKGTKLFVWTDGTVSSPWFSRIYSANPAWIAFNLLVNSRYGAGRWNTLCDIDLQSFKDWADYCDEMIDDGTGTGTNMKRWEIGIVFDSQQPVWEQVQKIAAAGRAVLIKTGRKIKVKIDRDTSPVQIFSMGNIIKDSFKLSYTPEEDRNNEVQIQFLNAEKEYSQDFATQQSANQDQLSKRRSESLYGITKAARAFRAARFFLNREELDRQTCEFSAPVDSIAAEPFDVIALAHDMPAWNLVGGRIHTNSGSTTVFLDRELVISGGQVPRITVRTHTTGVDIFQTRNITNGNGTYAAGTSLTVNSAWNGGDLPVIGNVYNLSTVSSTASTVGRLFKIVEITRNEDTTAKLVLVEHNPLVYDDTPVPSILSNPPGNEIPSAFDLPPDPAGLAGSVSFVTNPDGSQSPTISIGWTKPPFGAPYSNRIYIKLASDPTGGGAFDLVGETTGTGFVIGSNFVAVGDTYDIAVTSVSASGTEKDPDDVPFIRLAIVAPQSPTPPNISNFAASNPDPGHILLTWNPVPQGTPNFAGYEIRQGTNLWCDTILISRDITATQLELTSWFRPNLVATFQIKAYTTDGIYSDVEATVSITTSLGSWTAGTPQDEEPTWAGSKYNCTVVSSKLKQIAVGLELDTTTFTLDSEDAVHTDLEEALMAYVTSTYALGTNAARYIAVELDLLASGDALTINHSQFQLDSEVGQNTFLDIDDFCTGDAPANIVVELEISRSTDGVAFGAYEPFSNGLWVNCFAFKMKLKARRQDANYQFNFESMNMLVYTT